MNEAQLRDLVRQVVLEMLAKTKDTPVEPAKRALVLFTGAWLGFDESIRQLQRLRVDGLHLDIIQTESAKRFLEQDKIASLGPEVTANLVSTHPMLIIPTMTVPTAPIPPHTAYAVPIGIEREAYSSKAMLIATEARKASVHGRFLKPST